jgi:hypothetical protein
MKTLQESFEKTLQERIEFSNFAAQIIQEELEKQGIHLTQGQKTQLQKGLKIRIEEDSLAEGLGIQIDDDGTLSVTKDGGDTNKEFDITRPAEEKIANFLEKLPSVMIETAESANDTYLKNMRKRMPTLLREHEKKKKRFQRNLTSQWGRALNLLEWFSLLSQEIGAEYNDFIRSNEENKITPRFEILIRSHARACQVALEILALLKNGFADGAHARWRTLHEIAVETNIINKNDDELATRYLNFDAIQNYKSAKSYQEHADELHFQPLSNGEILKLEDAYKELVKMYGEDFANDNGWAIPLVKKSKPSFYDLEKIAEFDHIRPFYKLACLNVHGGPRGILFRLGLHEDQDILLAGPSSNGLGDPIQNTAYSLLQVTASLLTFEPNLDYLVSLIVLNKIEQEIFDATDKIVDEEHDV